MDFNLIRITTSQVPNKIISAKNTISVRLETNVELTHFSSWMMNWPNPALVISVSEEMLLMQVPWKVFWEMSNVVFKFHISETFRIFVSRKVFYILRELHLCSLECWTWGLEIGELLPSDLWSGESGWEDHHSQGGARPPASQGGTDTGNFPGAGRSRSSRESGRLCQATS